MLNLKYMCHFMYEGFRICSTITNCKITAITRPVDIAIWCHRHILKKHNLTIDNPHLRIIDFISKYFLGFCNFISS